MAKFLISTLILAWIGFSHGMVVILLESGSSGPSRIFFVDQNDQSRTRNVVQTRQDTPDRAVFQQSRFDDNNFQANQLNSDFLQNRGNQNIQQDVGIPQIERQPQRSRDNTGVHDSRGGREYHYSWRAGGRSFSHSEAVNYCSGLGDGWQLISLEDQGENDFITRVIDNQNVQYIWTSGVRQGGSFVWGTGVPVGDFNWGRTGSTGRPQPDNAERVEDCLAILNRFYRNDGITWHDVGCFYRKPLVCERQI